MRGMDRQHAEYRYRTHRILDRDDGYVGLSLVREKADASPIEAARIIFWDACGQWYFETLDGDVPLAIVEEMIAEARPLVPGAS